MNINQIIILLVFVFSFSWMIIDQYYPNYRNYIIALWQFYVLKKYDKPLHFQLYNDLSRQLKNLEEAGVRKYEQNLVRMILNHAGKFKSKMSGKSNHKIKWKVKKQGKTFSNYNK